jgi:hypothetical protein
MGFVVESQERVCFQDKTFVKNRDTTATLVGDYHVGSYHILFTNWVGARQLSRRRLPDLMICIPRRRSRQPSPC